MHTAKDFWSLCRMHTHGKGATWRSPVLQGGPRGVLEGSLPCGLACGRTAKPAAQHIFAARQRLRTRQRACRTATSARTDTTAHGKAPATRQPSARTAKAFAVRIGDAHDNVHVDSAGEYDNVHVAVGTFAGRSLPCVHARQGFCRAYRVLCRAILHTATCSFPVV
jgi:hypothetical protein